MRLQYISGLVYNEMDEELTDVCMRHGVIFNAHAVCVVVYNHSQIVLGHAISISAISNGYGVHTRQWS